MKNLCIIATMKKHMEKTLIASIASLAFTLSAQAQNPLEGEAQPPTFCTPLSYDYQGMTLQDSGYVEEGKQEFAIIVTKNCEGQDFSVALFDRPQIAFYVASGTAASQPEFAKALDKATFTTPCAKGDIIAFAELEDEYSMPPHHRMLMCPKH